VVALAFNADGSRLYSADAGGTLKEWDVSPAPKVAPAEPVAKKSKDGTRQVVKQADGIHLRDAAGKDLLTFTKHRGGVLHAEISANGRYVLSSAFVDFVRNGDQKRCSAEVKVWDTMDGKVLLERTWEINTVPLLLKAAVPGWASISADGRRLVVALPEGGVKVWDLDAFREVFAIPDKADVVQLSPDGTRVLTMECPKLFIAGPTPIYDLKLWDVDDKKELYSGKVESFLFSRDGKRLALMPARRLISFQDRLRSAAIKVLDATIGAELATFEVKGHRFRRKGGPDGFSFAFGPDHDRLFATSDSEILVWDIAAAKQVFELKGHRDEVRSLTVSPDGKRLASLGGGEIILWETATGSELMRIPFDGEQLSFSPDGQRLAVSITTGPPDARVRFLDATPR
jgi:hypothetical protein